jgi:hypothetical protein
VDAFEYRTALGAFYDTTRFSADGTTLRLSFIPGGARRETLTSLRRPTGSTRGESSCCTSAGKATSWRCCVRSWAHNSPATSKRSGCARGGQKWEDHSSGFHCTFSRR